MGAAETISSPVRNPLDIIAVTLYTANVHGDFAEYFVQNKYRKNATDTPVLLYKKKLHYKLDSINSINHAKKDDPYEKL